GRRLVYHLAFDNRQLSGNETLQAAGVVEDTQIILLPEPVAGGPGSRGIESTGGGIPESPIVYLPQRPEPPSLVLSITNREAPSSLEYCLVCMAGNVSINKDVQRLKVAPAVYAAELYYRLNTLTRCADPVAGLQENGPRPLSYEEIARRLRVEGQNLWR